jgi:S-phase kinase-associated protein 1
MSTTTESTSTTTEETRRRESPLLKAGKEDKEPVTLVTKDGYRETVPRHVFSHSTIIMNMLEEEDEDDDPETGPVVPLPNIAKTEFLKVLEYARYNWNKDEEEIEKPLKDKLENVVKDETNKKFVQSLYAGDDNIELLVNMLNAANYLDMRNLLHLCAAQVASTMKGKSVEEIRALFDIECDFTPEELERIKEENKWCEDASES